MQIPKLTYLRVDDWEALYADDRLIDQGHSIQWNRALEDVGIEIETKWVEKWCQEYNIGHFPARLSECEDLYAD